jgi:eukaryotic-like serine/threonine-protein kinase
MPDAAHSGRLQRDWTTRVREEERKLLQERLVAFSTALFASFLALVVLMFTLYAYDPTIEPANQGLIYGIATLALAILAVLWRGLLLRRRLSMERLYTIDLVITLGSGLIFGTVAVLAYELEAAAYTCLLYESFVVFTRALLIPCRRSRTLVVSSLAFVPIVTGSIVLAWLDAQGIAHLGIPSVGFVIGNLVLDAVAVLLATKGSSIIYDLRQDVKKEKKVGDLHLGQYMLGEKIGSGGMGEVFRATHAMLRRETAIKLVLPGKVSPKAFTRFEDEVQAMSRLTHPNTVAVFDYGRSLDGRLYYAMEYLDGVDLQRLVTVHGGPLPAGRVIHILQQVCGALEEAHRKGIIHRDIKPANIILCEERGGIPDFAKVVDFGLVEIRGATSDANVHGTPEYLAPELVVPNPGTVEPSVDLYALGAVGYFLLSGQHVFSGSINEVLVAQVSERPRPISEVASRPVPPALEAAIARCLAKHPPDRFPSAAALADELATIATDDWSRADATAWWSKRSEARKRPPPTSSAKTVTLAIELDPRVT